MPLTPADQSALTQALHGLKIDPVHGGELRAILAIDTSQPDSPDRLQTLMDYVTNPENPGSSVIDRPSMTSQDFSAMLVAADLEIGSKGADLQATYDRIVRKLGNLVTIKLTDEAWQGFIGLLTEHNLVTQTRLEEFTKARVSLVETAIGKTVTREELSSVVWADNGDLLL